LPRVASFVARVSPTASTSLRLVKQSRSCCCCRFGSFRPLCFQLPPARYRAGSGGVGRERVRTSQRAAAAVRDIADMIGLRGENAQSWCCLLRAAFSCWPCRDFPLPSAPLISSRSPLVSCFASCSLAASLGDLRYTPSSCHGTALRRFPVSLFLDLRVRGRRDFCAAASGSAGAVGIALGARSSSTAGQQQATDSAAHAIAAELSIERDQAGLGRLQCVPFAGRPRRTWQW